MKTEFKYTIYCSITVFSFNVNGFKTHAEPSFTFPVAETMQCRELELFPEPNLFFNNNRLDHLLCCCIKIKIRGKVP